MEKRLVLAIALSIFIIFGFQYLAPKGPAQKAPDRIAPQKTASPVAAEKTEISPYQPSALSTEEKCLEVQTGRYILTFSNIGGSIKEIRLKDYKNPNSNNPLDLVRLNNMEEYIFGITSPQCVTPLDSSAYEVEKTDNAITYSLRLKDLEITKKYILHNSKYIIELQLSVKNISGAAKEFNYRIIGGAGVTETSDQDKRFVEVTSKINSKILNFKRPKNERIINPGIVSWTALKNKYFSIILKPLITTKNQFYSSSKDGWLVVGVDTATVTIQPGSFLENKFVLYVGPSQVHVLKEVGYEFEETLNYGFFGGISKVLIYLMRFFYGIVHSWGISIILLAVFLNLILFPLTLKSFKSMRKMQELHPEMEKLKAKYKENPQKLNKEIMELYKQYKINPLSGCLPMLLQMPVFIALWQALMRSVELRSTKFLWIRDMSLPDAVKIPVSLPLIGNSINILPIIMVILMVLQQKISTKSMGGAVTPEQKQQQEMMLIVMPVIFGFIFYNMPSGLVLYWVVSTLLTIIEQGAMLREA